jgi:hypothetical protein
MKNLKKTLVMCICLVLIAVMAIGGTVAYLTVDPIEKGNVFSVGNIDDTKCNNQKTVCGIKHIAKSVTQAECNNECLLADTYHINKGKKDRH